MYVTSQPVGAAWYLNGSYAGATPDEMKGLDAGRYRVSVKKKGYEYWRGAVTVGGGEEARVSANLKEVAREVREVKANGMVLINGGCFQMGDIFGDGDSDEKPVG